jgi:hypothetical protein
VGSMRTLICCLASLPLNCYVFPDYNPLIQNRIHFMDYVIQENRANSGIEDGPIVTLGDASKGSAIETETAPAKDSFSVVETTTPFGDLSRIPKCVVCTASLPFQ